MKGSTLIGIIVGTVAILGAFIWEGGRIDYLFLLPPMIIVIIGTLAAGLAGHSFEMFARMPKLMKIAINPPEQDYNSIITQIVFFSSVARRDGLLALERKLDMCNHPYLRKLLELCIDGADPKTFAELAEGEVSSITDRHMANIAYFNKLGGYSPTMGIIGTVMGLISTLASAGSEPDVLIRHIASAFIATLWGIFMANIVWLPIADKLRYLHDEEMKLYGIMINGVHALQIGEVPSIIHARLVSSLPLSEQKHIILPKKYKDESAILLKKKKQSKFQERTPQDGR